ncbi:hypothetical protein, partial [Agrococcus sp. HG114]|uniref:hypothetical protein n=1 Tax=Agrococcus sp. HG114 TaxID=2969757 RepID=UPI00215A41ED
EELRGRVDERLQRQVAEGAEAARRAGGQVRRAADMAAARAEQGVPSTGDPLVEALVGRLDLADAERVRRRGSSLVRSSLTTSALSKTSLTLDSLQRRRR